MRNLALPVTTENSRKFLEAVKNAGAPLVISMASSQITTQNLATVTKEYSE